MHVFSFQVFPHLFLPPSFIHACRSRCKTGFVHVNVFNGLITHFSSCKKYIKAKVHCVIMAVFFHVRKAAFPLRYCHKWKILSTHMALLIFFSDLIGLFSVNVERNVGYTLCSRCCRETTQKPHNFPQSHSITFIVSTVCIWSWRTWGNPTDFKCPLAVGCTIGHKLHPVAYWKHMV